jgi:acetyl/propionyl-CoA carboxylase alpha subunit
MLGKVIVWGIDREAARESMVEALDQTAILGLTTNTGFLRALAASDEFRDATIDTAWLDRHEVPPPDDTGARALAGIMLRTVLEATPRGPWQPDGFRLGGAPGHLVEFGRDLSATGWFAAPRSSEGVQRVGSLTHGDGYVLRGPHGTEVVVRGQRFTFDRHDPFADRGPEAGDGTLLAPMPGTVLAVNVAEGQAVAEGETLGVMEAMKMELALKAPFAGTVTTVGATTGDLVKLGAVLFTVEESG